MPGLSLNEASQVYLLKIARETLEKFTRAQDPPILSSKDPAFCESRACFVTLKKEGVLRGCVGALQPEASLLEEVKRLTIAAASEDMRFPPVREEELVRIKIEISILSPLEPIKSWDEIEVGRHGISVQWQKRRGIFLPEVASEMNWTAEEFVKNCVREKARLPEETWPEVQLYRFTTEKIKE